MSGILHSLNQCVSARGRTVGCRVDRNSSFHGASRRNISEDSMAKGRSNPGLFCESAMIESMVRTHHSTGT